MADANPQTTPPPSGEPLSEPQEEGGWFKKNWKALLAGIAGLFALGSGGGMGVMLIGAILLMFAAVSLLKPEALDRAGDAVQGLYDSKVKPRVEDGIARGQELAETLSIPGAGLSAEQLKTTDPVQVARMSQQEKDFESWALDKVNQGKMPGNTAELRALLNEMRTKGGDGENAKLAETAADDKFMSGLPDELKVEAAAKLAAISPQR